MGRHTAKREPKHSRTAIAGQSVKPVENEEPDAQERYHVSFARQMEFTVTT
ncbi:hypothetical protein AJ80_08822 [Polytolypa hystricis UAMH7299]|uniref:Uncharacterized protein n=1 Tax=Polytolypa hystricis (strain UAMH7299) TaxID=1447883 RepID=A0A2B7X1A1_POLH7|nr:hypothetical protein AJ80_08822 [Polytolypa hystricis UAMH7299]